MNEALLNGSLTVAYPDGFHVMDADEQQRVFQESAPNRWGIWDTERHVIISVQWHESHPSILGKIAGVKDLAKRNEHAAAKAYKREGYKAGDFFAREICGREACGFRYDYVVQGIQHAGEVDVFLQPIEGGNCCYTLSMQGRKENAQENYALFEEMLSSLRLA